MFYRVIVDVKAFTNHHRNNGEKYTNMEGLVHLMSEATPDKPVTMLCLLSAPNLNCITNLPVHLGIPLDHLINVTRVTQRNGQVTVILSFNSHLQAEECLRSTNGSRLSDTDPATCMLLPITDFLVHTNHQIIPDDECVWEIPSCPMCIQRIDTSITGMVRLTDPPHPIINMTGFSCIVCTAASNESRLQCADCDTTSELWICMICARVGCNRYGNSHALRHYEQYGHRFSLELISQHIWDYAHDTYAHRLLLSRSNSSALVIDGDNGGSKTEDLEPTVMWKLDSVAAAYNSALYEQLVSQACHYEAAYEQKSQEFREQRDHSNIILSDSINRLRAIQNALLDSSKKNNALRKEINKVHSKRKELDANSEFLRDHNKTILLQKPNQTLLDSIQAEVKCSFKSALEEQDRLIAHYTTQVEDRLSRFSE